MGLRATPAQAGDAQERGAIRVPFLLVPFLWASKEKELAGGARPALKQNAANGGFLNSDNTSELKTT